MKNLLLSIILVLVSFVSFGQATTETLTEMKNGHFRTFNSTYADTLTSADTLNIVVLTKNYDGLNFAVDQRQTAVANDTTVTVTFYESMDGVTWHRVQKSNSGAQANLDSTVLAKGSDPVSITPEVSEGKIRMRYLKIEYVSPTQAGFKKVIYGTLKVYKGK